MSKDVALPELDKNLILRAFSETDGLKCEIQKVKQLVDAFEHDMSTAKGRDATRSFARKIPKYKTKLDNLATDLTEEWKRKKAAVDKNRRTMKLELDELRDEARRPLTEWENEQARIEAEAKAAEEAKAMLAQKENDHEMALLMDREHDRIAEEARLEAERVRIEQEAEAKRIQEERDKEIAEQARVEAEREKQAAIEREQAAIAAKEKAEKDAIEAARLAEIAAAKAKARAEEQAKFRAEQARLAEVARQEQQAENERREREARENDAKHKKKVNSDIFRAIAAEKSLNIDKEEVAKLIVLIAEGKIPNIKINY